MTIEVKRLTVLCPQQYVGMLMKVTPCSRCYVGWDKKQGRCVIETGAEHLPDDLDVPACPLQDRCQHQLQSEGACVIRRKGLICESALFESGLSEDDAFNHPRSFNADTVITPEELRGQ